MRDDQAKKIAKKLSAWTGKKAVVMRDDSRKALAVRGGTAK